MSSNSNDTSLNDCFFTLIAILLAVVVLLVPWINEVTKQSSSNTKYSLAFTITWPYKPVGANVDLDLWVRAPRSTSTGYSSKNTEFCDLVRDDLGNAGDSMQVNFEITYCRQLQAGEYIMNVHWYNHDSEPIPIDYEIRAKDGDREFLIESGEAIIKKKGEQLTVIRFTLSSGFQVMQPLTNRIPIDIRSSK